MAAGDKSGISSGAIISETLAVIRRNWLICLVSGLAFGGLAAAIDLSMNELMWMRTAALYTRIATLPFTLLIQYFVIGRLMFNEESSEKSWSTLGIIYYLGTAIIAGIGAIVGMIFLLVPGFILIARWNIALNFAIGQQSRPVEALGASWEATRNSAGAIFGVMVLLGLVNFIGGFAIGVAFGMSPVSAQIPQTVVTSLFAGFMSAIGLCVPVATYALLVVPVEGRLNEIFN